MADEGDNLSLTETTRRWLIRRFGRRGLILGLVLAAAIYVYANWAQVLTWPGVAPAIQSITRSSIPQADPDRYSVLIAHLENDNGQELERLIIEALAEFEGIQVLALDRLIPLKGSIPEEAEKNGHEQAGTYLEESKASLLIWGKVLPYQGKTIPKLFWTPAGEKGQKTARYDAPLLADQFDLPELFWSDLSSILQLLVVARSSEFHAQTGHYVADRLTPFIARVQTLLQASTDRPGWKAITQTKVRVILADALSTLGEQSGNNKPLEQAVDAFRETLKEYTQDRVPLQWAATQNNLGNALAIWGKREAGTQRLEQAVDAYREALKEYTQDRVPLQWAGTQNNLGNALQTLGEREAGTQRLEQAVDAYREALKEYTQDRVPLDWAMTQNNLGTALQTLGQREAGTQQLEQAVDAFRQALTIFEPAGASYYVEGTKSNLNRAETLLRERTQTK